MTAKDLEKKILKAGWVYDRQTGSHRQYKHNDYPYIITIPFHKGDLKTGLLHRILKDAGLK